MTFDDLAKPPILLTTLETQGYTHLCWKCTACGLECARGFQLLRIRGRLGNDSTITSVARKLRCPRCFHRPSPEMVKARRAEGSTDRRRAGRPTAARLASSAAFSFLALLPVACWIALQIMESNESRLMRVGAISLIETAATLCLPPLPGYKQSGTWRLSRSKAPAQLREAAKCP